MNNEKRLILFFALVSIWFMVAPAVFRFFGIELAPKRPVKPPANAAAEADKKADPNKKAEPDQKGEPGKVETAQGAQATKSAEVAQARPTDSSKPAPELKARPEPRVEVVKPTELELGGLLDHEPVGYRLQVGLEQKGAGIRSILSSRYDEDFGERKRIKLPLELVRRDAVWPPSLALTLNVPLVRADQKQRPAEPADPLADDPARSIPVEVEDTLDSVVWEVVRDDKGTIKRSVTRTDRATGAKVEGQAIAFRTTSSQGVVITKTFRLWQESDSVELELRFESPTQTQKIVYNLLGPHGIRIEGEWYTSTFRDLVFGQLSPSGVEIATYSAADVVGATGKPIENMTLPIRFGGIENQYFATLLAPYPPPAKPEDRWDDKTTAFVLHKDAEAPHKSEIGLKITSRPVEVAPDHPVTHTYQVYAGPKIEHNLTAVGAEGLASYRKSSIIPFANYIARVVITPALGIMYDLTERISRLFGGSRGNYGVAIILLTMVVRGLMFPIGRKQALAAQKMQTLQPLLKDLQERYKDDKERLTRETFALYKKHGVNPVAGCLPALIQLPIFVGLWQALNTSFMLRHSPFLWIQDLAAPDMLFRFPFDLPTFGNWINLGNWFNVLPFLVVGLMLVQTKLFSPPATTPEAVQQQKVMKFMMVFMGFMFYKVPSGLGLYFITSSLWAICERLLLPRISHARDAARPGDDTAPGVKGQDGELADDKPKGKFGQLWDKLLEEARKDSTYRKVTDESNGDGSRDRSKPRARPRKR